MVEIEIDYMRNLYGSVELEVPSTIANFHLFWPLCFYFFYHGRNLLAVHIVLIYFFFMGN